MKKFSLLIAMLMMVTIVDAQTATLLQHAGTSSAFYGNLGLQNAYASAVNGDTIYLPGGYYNAITIDKKIAIIGAGHHPDSSAVTFPTVINGSFGLNENADGTSLIGLYINGGVSTGYNISVNNLLLQRLYLTGGININGDRSNPSINGVIRECIMFSEVFLANVTQFTITNNIIGYRLNSIESCIIANNIFLGGDDYGNIVRVLYSVNQSLVRNNVFYKSVMDFPGSVTNQFQNNIFVNTPPLTDNTWSGNYFNVAAADIFVSYDNTGFKYTHNFHLKTPASYAGTDATQVGLYGTTKPWKEGSVPMNPHMQSKTIAENTDADGKIQVQVKVAAQNN
jgi:hypothetical protein